MSDRKIVLGVDLDEVVYKYLEGLRSLMAADGLVAPEGEPLSYSMHGSGWFPTPEDYVKYHGAQVDAGLYEKLELHEGASETLWDLSDSGYKLNIITSRFVLPGQHEKVVKQTVRTLDRDSIPYSNLSFLSSKADQYADAYIDDSPTNLESLTGTGRLVIRRVMKYNELSPGVPASSWKEIREVLRSHFGR